MKSVTIVDGQTVEVDAANYSQPVPPPGTIPADYSVTVTSTENPNGTTTVNMAEGYEPLWWMKTVPVMQSELYIAGTDLMLCASEAPVPNWFRRCFARLAGFEWRVV